MIIIHKDFLKEMFLIGFFVLMIINIERYFLNIFFKFFILIICKHKNLVVKSAD